MENHTEDFTGLESLGNSQSVTSIEDFLSLEQLGLTRDESDSSFIPLDDVNKTASTDKNKTPEASTEATEEVVETPTIELPNLNTGKDKSEDNLEGLSELDKGIDLEVPPVTGEVNYKSVLQDLIQEGILPDIEAFETEDGEVSFEDMEINKDTLLTLIKQTQDGIKEDMKASSVDIEGISDFTKKLINIEKHGGNVQQALETYQQVKHPIESIDLSDLRGQKAMCYLRLQAQGIDDTLAKDLIKSYELQGVLEDRALESKEQLDKAFTDSIVQQEAQAIEEEKQFKTALKTYRATLDNVLKDQQVTDTHRKKLLDIATKPTESGDFELDTLIENFRKNPIDAADLIMFVTDKDQFIKNKAEVLVKQERVSTLRKISVIPKGKSSNLTVPEKSTREDPNLLDLSKL